MSSEWRTYRIQDVGRLVTGKTPKSGVPSFEGDDVPFVSPPDFAGNKWITKTVRSISEAGAHSIKGSLIPPRSVLVTCIGSDMGKAAIAAYRCVTNQQINAILVDESRFCPEFVYYNLSLRKDEIRSLAGGSAQPILNKSAFGQICLAAPCIEVQRKVTAALRPLDDRISLLRETNATLETIAHALFKSWFVDFDPVRAKMAGRAPEGMDEATAALFPDSMEATELGLVPEGWRPRPVYDSAEFINGAAYKAFAPNAERLGLPIIKISELKAGVTSQTAYSDVAMPSKYLIETADILFSWSGNPDTSIDTFVWAHQPAWLNQHIFRVIPLRRIERTYLLQMLRWLKPVFTELARNKQTTGLGHVTVADLKRLTFAWPDEGVVKAFDAVVGQVQQRILTNEQQAISLAVLRDTLLPRLISGQLRLPEADGEVLV